MTDDQTLIVGVDGGRTKTIALVADIDGRILGAGKAGDPTFLTSDLKRSMGFVFDAAGQAMPAARSAGDVAWSMLGLAGADWPEDREARLRTYQEQGGIAGGVTVKNDAFLGLRASLISGQGAIVIAAGTGANVALITPQGEEWHYGAYARSGGAKDVALTALEAVFRAADGRGDPTSLSSTVPRHLEFDDVDDVLRADVAGRLPLKSVFSLAPLVLEAAEEGDLVAARIVGEQAAKLAEYAVAAARRFEMVDLAFPVVLAGGLFRGSALLLTTAIESRVLSVLPRVRFVRPQLEPAIGALLYCYDSLGTPITEDLVDRLMSTSPPLDFFST